MNIAKSFSKSDKRSNSTQNQWNDNETNKRLNKHCRSIFARRNVRNKITMEISKVLFYENDRTIWKLENDELLKQVAFYVWKIKGRAR